MLLSGGDNGVQLLMIMLLMMTGVPAYLRSSFRICRLHAFPQCFRLRFHHSVVCFTTGPYPLSKRVLHREGSSASSFYFQYLLVSLRSSSNCVCLLPRLPVTSIFPSVMCFRWQSLRKMWPIQLAFLLYSVCLIFHFSLSLCSTFLSLTLSYASFSSTALPDFPGNLTHFPKCPRFSTTQCSAAPNVAPQFLLP